MFLKLSCPNQQYWHCLDIFRNAIASTPSTKLLDKTQKYVFSTHDSDDDGGIIISDNNVFTSVSIHMIMCSCLFLLASELDCQGFITWGKCPDSQENWFNVWIIVNFASNEGMLSRELEYVSFVLCIRQRVFHSIFTKSWWGRGSFPHL